METQIIGVIITVLTVIFSGLVGITGVAVGIKIRKYRPSNNLELKKTPILIGTLLGIVQYIVTFLVSAYCYGLRPKDIKLIPDTLNGIFENPYWILNIFLLILAFIFLGMIAITTGTPLISGAILGIMYYMYKSYKQRSIVRNKMYNTLIVLSVLDTLMSAMIFILVMGITVQLK